ncbi:hypothetical protein AJ78_04606 [Emergomyces pasteurianus Ep9510]|uniref:Uncharacterized protein n=1 Tax=Emergomyces pasteurianus Ep9510 TaxID=1447872 RepID=A0A1J9PF63_9EURO|nr:hypothetical protein AJ78_04606 [Emergomyces pasteurianus Ep9510]
MCVQDVGRVLSSDLLEDVCSAVLIGHPAQGWESEAPSDSGSACRFELARRRAKNRYTQEALGLVQFLLKL